MQTSGAVRASWFRRKVVPHLAALVLLVANDTHAHVSPAKLSVLTYNIHGLQSWIARDDPPARIRALLPRTQRYELVLLQEDFAHQALVNSPHRRREAVRAAPADGVPFGREGNGLTLLTDLALVDPPRAIAYRRCNGWLSAASDCLADKGALLQRVQLPNGQQVDVWNTHLDAGRGDADHAARSAQLAAFASAIDEHSRGRALILGGDFNLHWDVARDRRMLTAFARQLGLTLAARVPDTGPRKRVDYLFYRATPELRMRVRSYGVARGFEDAKGAPLSDHPPVYAEFEFDYALAAPPEPGR